MKILIKCSIILLLLTISKVGYSASTTEVVCALAPSQSEAVRMVSSMMAAGGAASQVTLMTSGITLVPHSSTLPILTGSAGYIAGTMQGALITATVVKVAVVVAGTAVLVELVCAPKNHKELVDKAIKGAKEYSSIASTNVRGQVNNLKEIGKVKLEIISKEFKKYKTISEDRIYELLGETWYERMIRKTKSGLGIS